MSEDSRVVDTVSQKVEAEADGEGGRCVDWSRWRFLVSVVSVEPLMFLHALSTMLQLTLYSSFVMDKICLKGSNWFSNGKSYQRNLCTSLDNGTFDHIQVDIQRAYSRHNLAEAYLGQIPAIFFILFGGRWSDHHGRKVIIFVSWFFEMLGNIFLLANIVFYDAMETDWMIFRALGKLMGGTIGFYLGLYSYIADVSSVKHRLMRIAILDIAYFTGKILASAISGHLYTAYGYVSNVMGALMVDAVGLVYLFAFVREPARVTMKEKKKGLAMEALTMFKGSIVVLARRRAQKLRHIIWLTLIVFLLNNVAREDQHIDAPYVRRIFEWKSLDEFNLWWGTYSSVTSWLYVVAILILPCVNKVLHYNDLWVTMLSAISGIGMAVIYLIAWNPAALYISNVVGLFGSVATSGLRSHLSKLVEVTEIGQIMGCVALLQATSAFLRPLYNVMYNATIEWFVGFVYCFTIVQYVIVVILLIYISLFMRRVQLRSEQLHDGDKDQSIVLKTFACNDEVSSPQTY